MTKYIKIPSDLILYENGSDICVLLFYTLTLVAGLDGKVRMSLNDIVQEMGAKPNRSIGGINSKVIEQMFTLRDMGYVSIDDEDRGLTKQSATFTTLLLNLEEINNANPYSYIFIDEFQAIMNYTASNNDARLSARYMCLLLSYIRLYLNRRQNVPRCTHKNIKTISSQTGMNEHIVSRTIQELEDAGLVVSEIVANTVHHVASNGTDVFIVAPTIFALTHTENAKAFNPKEEIGKYKNFLRSL